MDRLIAVFVIFLGVNFLFRNFGWPSVDLRDVFQLWPLALIWVGWMMWRDAGNKKCRRPDDE